MCTGTFRVFAAESWLAVNPIKCSVLPSGALDCTTDIGCPLLDNMKVLGIKFCQIVQDSIRANWKNVVAAVKRVLSSNTGRLLSLQLRAEFVSVFALAKLWHAA